MVLSRDAAADFRGWAVVWTGAAAAVPAAAAVVVVFATTPSVVVVPTVEAVT